MISLKDAVSFKEIRERIKQYLDAHDKLDLSSLSAVSLLVDTIAAGIEVSKFEVLRALQETYLQSAQLDDSVYQLVKTLHVQLITKSCCFSTMTVKSQADVAVPAYTQFVADGINVFNVDKFVSTKTPQKIDVYEGKIHREELIVENSTTQLTLKIKDFKVDVNKLECSVDGVVWNLYNGDNYNLAATSQVFLIDISKDGNITIFFGNGTFGALPPVGSKITFTYPETLGGEGCQMIQSKVFKAPDYPQIEAIGNGTLLGGDDQKNAAFYKKYAPWLAASKNWASRKKDFVALAVCFPGVIDCSVQTQSDIDPNDRRYENFVQLTLLTSNKWSQRSWRLLEQYLAYKSSGQLHFIEKKAVPIEVDLNFTVYCAPNALLDSVKANVEKSVKTFLSPRAGILGKSVYLGDLEQIVVASDPLIKSYTRHAPNIDYTKLEYYEYLTYKNVNIECKYAE